MINFALAFSLSNFGVLPVPKYSPSISTLSSKQSVRNFSNEPPSAFTYIQSLTSNSNIASRTNPITEIYTSGRTLYIKRNSLSVVSIRARNLSGTGCQARVSFNQGFGLESKFIYAPPVLQWGRWTDISGGLTGGTFKMDITKLCDSGPMQYEVKYWPR